ncbi:hypothetical protein CkaCkLH20_12622 [Colletotrichum karsti]|uniref:Uncharacterized protein n=1 Tax=Colletotrichum karsti TaxID=1095194 RepID=A0A9P6HTY2_9PEZI|nr:uncharacterized protein CkaCkLH20_12622 [Colletotrichum karsti]KAF9869915.1 hypothetical protein CkaCkLH20_12622 [Colletotrichum karsti]
MSSVRAEHEGQESLDAKIESFINRLPTLHDLISVHDDVVLSLIEFEKSIASDIDFLHFRDGLPDHIAEVLIHCIGHSAICKIHHRFPSLVLFYLGWCHGRGFWEELRKLAASLCWTDAIDELRQEADARRQLDPKDRPGIHVHKSGVILSDIAAVLVRQGVQPKCHPHAKTRKAKTRQDDQTPSATSNEEYGDKQDSSRDDDQEQHTGGDDDEQHATGGHGDHHSDDEYEQDFGGGDDDEHARAQHNRGDDDHDHVRDAPEDLLDQSLDAPDIGFVDAVAPPLDPPSLPSPASRPWFGLPEPFGCHVSEGDSSPRSNTIDGSSSLSSQVNISNVHAKPFQGPLQHSPSSYEDVGWSGSDDTIDVNESVKAAAMADLSNVTIKRPRSRSDASAISTKRPKMSIEPKHLDIDNPHPITKASAWIRGDWLNDALTAMTRGLEWVALLDFSAVANLDKPNCEALRNVVATIESESTTLILLPIQPCAASLYDSLPSGNNTRFARKRTERFFQCYFPNAPVSSNRIFKSMAGPRQQNTDDYGVYVFATALYIIVGEDLPSEVHSPLWRQFMAAALGQPGDWAHVLPLPPAQDIPVHQPTCDGPSAEAFRDWTSQVKRWHDERRELMLQKVHNDIILSSTTLVEVEPAVKVASILYDETKSMLDSTTAQMFELQKEAAREVEVTRLKLQQELLQKSRAVLAGLVEALEAKEDEIIKALNSQEEEAMIWEAARLV